MKATATRKMDNQHFTGNLQTLCLNSNPSINLTIQQDTKTWTPLRASKARKTFKSGTTFASMAKLSFNMVYGEGCVHFDAIDYEAGACMQFTLPCQTNIQGTGFSQFGFNNLKDILKTASYKGTSVQITRLKNKLLVIKPVGNDSVIDIVKEYETIDLKNL